MIKLSPARKVVRTLEWTLALLFVPLVINMRLRANERGDESNARLAVEFRYQLDAATKTVPPGNIYKTMLNESYFAIEQIERNVPIDDNFSYGDTITISFYDGVVEEKYNKGLEAVFVYKPGTLDTYDKNPDKVDFTNFISAKPQITDTLKKGNINLFKHHLEDGQVFLNAAKTKAPKQRLQLHGPNH